MPISQADLSETEGKLEAKLDSLISSLNDLSGKVQRNIDQDRQIRADMDSLSKSNTIIGKLNNISSAVDGLNTELQGIRNDITGLSGDISSLSSQISSIS